MLPPTTISMASVGKIQLLAALLDKYDACALECDGLIRVIHTVLAQANVPHQVYAGKITQSGTGQVYPVHLWIELVDGRKVDYRARMWLGEADVPHGVFSDCQAVVYAGAPIEINPLPEWLFKVLTEC